MHKGEVASVSLSVCLIIESTNRIWMKFSTGVIHKLSCSKFNFGFYWTSITLLYVQVKLCVVFTKVANLTKMVRGIKIYNFFI
jgi:hypothetical protein